MTILKNWKKLHTSYYKEFTDLIGPSVHNLNTICVGLEQIENNNYKKPETLTISWKSQDPITDASRARRYAINLFLIAAIDAIENYISSICSVEQFISSKVVYKVENAVGIREQVKELFVEVKGNSSIKPYWVPSIRLLIAWRNIIVHKSKAKVVLEIADKKALECASKEIYKLHSKTNIYRTLIRFEAKEQPTLKDFSTLFTILLKAFKTFDEVVSDAISAKTVKELIKDNLRESALSDFDETKPNDMDKLKKYCSSKSIKYDNEITYNDLKKKIVEKSTEAKFNKLIANRLDPIKRIRHFCVSNSIPYYNDIVLKEVLAL